MRKIVEVETLICDRCGEEIHGHKFVHDGMHLEMIIRTKGEFCDNCEEILKEEILDVFNLYLEKNKDEDEDEDEDERIIRLDPFKSGSWTYIVNGKCTKHNSLQDAVNALHKDLEVIKATAKKQEKNEVKINLRDLYTNNRRHFFPWV